MRTGSNPPDINRFRMNWRKYLQVPGVPSRHGSEENLDVDVKVEIDLQEPETGKKR